MINNSTTTQFDPARPWPWVSCDDPAWTLTPWPACNDEDLAEAATRVAIDLLRMTEGITTLQAAALVEDAVRRVVADVVAESRTRRLSWGRIAQQLGVGRTAAQKRFGKWPDASRADALENQYELMGWYLHEADRGERRDYPHRNEVRETRARCIRRRRGHALDPLDTFHKVVAPRKRATTNRARPDPG